MRSNLELSVVIPAYNEQEVITECLQEVHDVFKRTGRSFEIIVVDDGSTDDTFHILRGLKPSVPELRALRFKKNTGQTAAMEAGFRNARGDIVITLDADMQNDPADIPALLSRMNEWDVVCGVRTARQDNFIRRISSRVANGVRNKMTGENITDTGCTLKIYRREYLVKLKLFEGMHRFLPTLLRMVGARVTEMPVNHRPRLKGKAKYTLWNRVFKSARDLVAVRWMRRRWLNYEIREEIK